MGTVRQYFDNDFPHVIRLEEDALVDVEVVAGQTVPCCFPYRLHADYNANAIFLSAYFAHPEYSFELAESFLEHADELAARATNSVLGSGLASDPLIHGRKLRFAGSVFLYIDAELSERQIQDLESQGKQRGLRPVIRGRTYSDLRTSEDKPVAFISYDSRDRADIAKPLAQRLAALGCHVWYDEFSLRIGDSLRESIDRGIRECEKCILVISPNFLTNSGWTKSELDQIFTREVHEKHHRILPIWAGVTKQEVYDYSLDLANRKAIAWDRGLDEVVQEIRKVVGP